MVARIVFGSWATEWINGVMMSKGLKALTSARTTSTVHVSQESLYCFIWWILILAYVLVNRLPGWRLARIYCWEAEPLKLTGDWWCRKDWKRWPLPGQPPQCMSRRNLSLVWFSVSNSGFLFCFFHQSRFTWFAVLFWNLDLSCFEGFWEVFLCILKFFLLVGFWQPPWVWPMSFDSCRLLFLLKTVGPTRWWW